MESTSTSMSATYGQRINLLSDFNVIRYTRSLKNKGENIVQFIKYFRLRWCGHVERMPKQTAAVTAEGIRNRRRRPRTRWRDEVERDLNTRIMGIKDRKWPVQRSTTAVALEEEVEDEEEAEEGGRWPVKKGPCKHEFRENGAVIRTEAEGRK